VGEGRWGDVSLSNSRISGNEGPRKIGLFIGGSRKIKGKASWGRSPTAGKILTKKMPPENKAR
jgi:hypothetical protein